ncbi:MAG TPA: FtsX-like permease family protein, partial [Thermoanaerobaculia bacterium]|nr:FtsX-like permease family protein [Thermoanaerobaculia bacterium]
SFAIPAWVFALVVVTGIIVPLLAAAVPVWRGSGVSIRRALADFGVAASGFGASPFDRLVANVGGLARPLLLAIRNNFRRRTRLALTVLTLAAGGLFFMTALNLRASMIHTLDRLFAEQKFDLSVAIHGPCAETIGMVRAIPGVRSAECVPNGIRLALEKTDPRSVEAMKTRIEERLVHAGIQVHSLTSKSDRRFGFDQHMVMIYVALIIMSAMIGGVGGLGLSTTMSLNVLERRREMAVLRAVGATPRTVWLLLVTEGCVLAVLSWLLAALAAWPLSKALGNLLLTVVFKRGIDFRFELQGLVIWLAISLVLGAAASFIPAKHSTSQPVREALGYE